MNRDSVAYYFHTGPPSAGSTQALGSTSLTTDQNQQVVARQWYYPYGETRWSDGTLPTDYQFTGQRAEDFGLYDYHARYYDAYINRWIQPDTIIPDPANPQSLNRYSYVYNRPLAFVDRDGHSPWPVVGVVIGGVVIGGVIGAAVVPHILPWDPPMMVTDRVADPITSSDMTEWLRNQMVTNAQSGVVQDIRANWTSGDLARKDAAMQAWTALVGTDNTWDFKYDIGRTGWFREGTRDVLLGNRQLNYDAVANIHFGFVGRAAGFDGDFLVQAAGFAQLKRFATLFDCSSGTSSR